MNRSRVRLAILVVLLGLWATVVVARLGQVQLERHDEFVRKAARQQERTLELTPVRGSILDARGRVLAESVAGVSIYADPQAIVDPRAAAAKLARVKEIGLSTKELVKRLSRGGEFAWVARQLPADVGERVLKLGIEGIYSLEEHRRIYPRASLAANVLGYVSIDGRGLAGVEHSADTWVHGKGGRVTILRDARRGMYLVGGEGVNARVDGLDVVLTIDEVVQHIAEKELAAAVKEWDALAGSVVVMDPRDGAILAMASLPTFDPNHFGRATPSAWRNRAVQDLYEPGSTFKVVAAAAGIEEGVVTPSQIVDCGEGMIQIASARIREHDGKRYGLLPFEDVMTHSSNVGTIRVALGVGPQRFYQWIRRFGFGQKTGIELPGEADGILRPPQRWSALSNAVISIGQEIAVTPLQMTQAMTAVASGGVMRSPHIVRKVVDRDGNVVWTPPTDAGTRVLSDRTAAVMNGILKAVVVRGTGKDAALAEYVVAGKTGTAQKPVRGGYHPSHTVASFLGYVPADRPRLAILVVIDEPRGGGYGGPVAGPVFRRIAEASLRYLDVPASLPRRELPLGTGARLATFSQPDPPPDPARGAGSSEAVVIPDLRGLDARRAIARATRAGFAVSAEGEGIVAAQRPSPGAAAKTGTPIALVMAPGERTFP